MSAETIVDPWERQPGETSRAFAAFTIYRDLPAADRSITKVAQIAGRSRVLIGRWSAAQAWVARVAAWDAEQDRLKRLAQIKEIEDMGRRQAAAGALMQTKGLAKIRSLVDRFDRDGREIELRRGQRYSDELGIQEAIRLVEGGVRVERVGRGEPDLYTPLAINVATNPVLETPIGAFMHQHPTRVGPIVELLERLVGLIDANGSSPAAKQVGPGITQKEDLGA